MPNPRRLLTLLAGALLPALAPAQPALPATVTVEYREVDLTYPAEAVVEAVRQATLAAQVPGRVLEARVDAGDRVRQGEVLMRIDEREAAQGLAGTQAQYENARTNYERTRNLHQQKFVSKAALDKAEADFKAAAATSGQAGTVLTFTRITSPLAGFVAQRHTEPGEMATPGKPLVTVYDPKGLRVTADIPQYKLAEVRRHLRAQVEFPETGHWLEAASVTVFPAADARTHTVRARVSLPEDLPGIIPGMFARAHFVIGRAKKLLVPAQAVLRRGEVTAVYVVDGQGAAHLRQVRLGEPLAGGFHEVLAGLSPGEKVALDPVKAGIAARRG